jgi:hydrogenase-1 operon protein HyaE
MVFLRDGGYLGAITRLLDWDDYLERIRAILAARPHEPPPFELPGGKTMAQAARASARPATRITFSGGGQGGGNG